MIQEARQHPRFLRARAIGSVAFSATGLVFIWASPVHAYVDPGIGLFIGQAIVSAVLGVLFVARSKVRRVIGRIFGRGKSTEASLNSEAKGESPVNSADAPSAESEPDRKSRFG